MISLSLFCRNSVITAAGRFYSISLFKLFDGLINHFAIETCGFGDLPGRYRGSCLFHILQDYCMILHRFYIEWVNNPEK